MLDASALAETAGPFKAFFEKLAGPEGPQWFAAFKRFLRKEDPWPQFPVWKTITLGTFKTVDGLRASLVSAGFRISDYAGRILAKNSMSPKKTKLDLVIVSGTDLGFTQAARRDTIYARALELGLRLCPAEVGPQLRLQYPDQPPGEWLLIAMEPLADSGGYLKVFSVEHVGSGRWLYSYYGEPGHAWYPAGRWVFLAPRTT
ncbi:MAG: hypothetical protein AAB375_01200 [Patescibacteria group bacterium]